MPLSKRIRYEAIICCNCSDEQLSAAGASILSALSEHFGGASMLPCTGAWAANGNDVANRYRSVQVHSGVMILLSVPQHQADQAYQVLTTTIALAVRQHNLPARYIHVDGFEARAFHFDVDTMSLCGARDIAPVTMVDVLSGQ
ncbi:MAG: hypothetical protein AWU57_928 [Marinobacter sp. T13-3]|nr:MAG: hypothetical protein AWU57_928 [Marinobacter sp. T13-3]